MRRVFVAVLIAWSCAKDTVTFVSDQNGTGELAPTPGGRAALPSAPAAAPDAGSVAVGSTGNEQGQGSIAVPIGEAAPPDAGAVRECARFLPIPLPAGFSASTDTHLSGDGLLVVANGALSVAYAHRWQQGNSMIVLSPLDGDTVSWVNAINRDGSVMVGGSSGPSGSRAVRWDGNGPPTPIGELSDGLAVSADGAIVLGKDANGFVRWRASGVEPISGLSSVNGMSADGSSLVGTPVADASAADQAALDAGNGLVFVGLPGELSSRATLISQDARVVVGTSIDSTALVRVFRWQAGTAEPLDGMSEPFDVNADGSVIVGTTSLQCDSGAGLWRLGRGVENLGCLLPAPIIPAQWQLTRITSVSNDGRIVSGSGINPDQVLQSWVAVLGEVCLAP